MKILYRLWYGFMLKIQRKTWRQHKYYCCEFLQLQRWQNILLFLYIYNEKNFHKNVDENVIFQYNSELSNMPIHCGVEIVIRASYTYMYNMCIKYKFTNICKLFLNVQEIIENYPYIYVLFINVIKLCCNAIYTHTRANTK